MARRPTPTTSLYRQLDERAAEQNTWQRYLASGGDDVVRNQLIEIYMPAVTYIAQRRATSMAPYKVVDVDDLISWGTFGLMQSIAKYDPEKGVLFGTFAQRRIDGAMVDGLRDCDWVPRQLRAEIARGDIDEVGLIHTSVLESSLNLLTDNSEEIGSQLDRDLWWRKALQSCTQRERLILIMYYRLDCTMRTVGQHVGLSESRVSQMMSVLKKRLKATELEMSE